jgi:hypothetical protein
MGESVAPLISSGAGVVKVVGSNYLWEYLQSEDTFRFLDAKGRVIVSSAMQPTVVVSPVAKFDARSSAPGKFAGVKVDHDRLEIVYEGVNDGARVSVSWRFDARGVWLEPVVYEAQAAEDVVSLYYFTDLSSGTRKASLHASFLVLPGISEGPGVSPIVRDDVHLNETVCLGRGSSIADMPGQQWGLPVHYFCGFSTDQQHGARGMYREGRSASFACGLAELPQGDLFLTLQEGKSSLWIDYRSDLWKHVRGPGKLSLGATMLWAVADDYYEAIAAYYAGLVGAGVIHRHQSSPKKTAVALTPQYCTWGAQVDRGKGGEKLDEATLRELYRELKASGMKAGLFSIDDKWEGTYGKLEHSAERFPKFEEFLAELRADGMKVGIWAALMRCERPADLGLTDNQMLLQPDGTPYVVKFAGSQYSILDFTQPEVAEVLVKLAKRFMQRYKPDLLKFDFGYELPPVGKAAPKDKNWSGERLLWKGLDIVIKAMREENPDLVVMYYNLSPLFLSYFDLHSPDDMYAAAGEYELEANRRYFFSSLLGPLGVPTYGSSGYDWASTASIWFDSAAMGTLGSLNDFTADEEDEGSNAGAIAKYNGLTTVLRPTATFEILPLDVISQGYTVGARARSWARMEDGELVLLAYRPPVMGETSGLASAQTDLRIKGAVRSSVPVVVAARGIGGIARSEELAIVPYESGDIFIRRIRGTKAIAVSHYLGGTAVTRQIEIAAGELKIEAQTLNGNIPLEWIEVKII